MMFVEIWQKYGHCVQGNINLKVLQLQLGKQTLLEPNAMLRIVIKVRETLNLLWHNSTPLIGQTVNSKSKHIKLNILDESLSSVCFCFYFFHWRRIQRGNANFKTTDLSLLPTLPESNAL